MWGLFGKRSKRPTGAEEAARLTAEHHLRTEEDHRKVVAQRERQLNIDNVAFQLADELNVKHEAVALPAVTWAFAWSDFYWEMVQEYYSEGGANDIAENPERETEILLASRQASLESSAGGGVSLDDDGIPLLEFEGVMRVAFYRLHDGETAERLSGLIVEHELGAEF